MENHTSRVRLYVTDLGRTSVILGLPWLRHNNPNIDWSKRTLHIEEKVATIGEMEHANEWDIYRLIKAGPPITIRKTTTATQLAQ